MRTSMEHRSSEERRIKDGADLKSTVSEVVDSKSIEEKSLRIGSEIRDGGVLAVKALKRGQVDLLSLRAAATERSEPKRLE